VTRQDQAYERIIEHVLVNDTMRHMPRTIDLWPKVYERLADHVRMSTHTEKMERGQLRRFTIITAVVCMVATVGSITGVAASSSRGHMALHQAVVATARLIGISVDVSNDGQDTGGFGISPAVSFHTAELHTIPGGLTEHTFTFIPAQQSGRQSKLSKPSVTIATAPQDLSVARRYSQQDLQKLFAPVGEFGVDTVHLRFSALPPQTSYLDIIEQPLQPGYRIPSGEAISIASTTATLQQAGNQTTVTLVRFNTMVILRTNMGRADALSDAGALIWK